MTQPIRVERVFPCGTGDWRAVRSNGDLLFEIRVHISARYNGSRYFVFSPNGDLVRHGRFSFELWDYPTMTKVLTTIVTTVAPGAEVDVEVSAPQQASGT